jgi:hypothetical protein
MSTKNKTAWRNLPHLWTNPTNAIDKTINAIRKSNLGADDIDSEGLITTISAFLRGDPVSTYKGHPIIRSSDDYLYTLQGNQLMDCGFTVETDHSSYLSDVADEISDNLHHAEALVTPAGLIVRRNTTGTMILINGDDNVENELPSGFITIRTACDMGNISVSLECIKQLEIDPDTINVIDASPDHSIRKPKIAKVPAGYTWMKNGTWHRPSSITFESQKKYFLLGQDEGSYFGCELPKKPKNLEDAYVILEADSTASWPADTKGKVSGSLCLLVRRMFLRWKSLL